MFSPQPRRPSAGRRLSSRRDWTRVSTEARRYRDAVVLRAPVTHLTVNRAVAGFCAFDGVKPNRTVGDQVLRSEIRIFLLRTISVLTSDRAANRHVSAILGVTFADLAELKPVTEVEFKDFLGKQYSITKPLEPLHRWSTVLRKLKNWGPAVHEAADAWVQMLGKAVVEAGRGASDPAEGAARVQEALSSLDSVAGRELKRYGIDWDGRLVRAFNEELGPSSRRESTLKAAPPIHRLIRSPRDAEVAAAEWIRYWGWADAAVTGMGADEGVDVEGADVVAQVKAHMAPIGRPDIQNLVGVAAVRNKQALFFSLTDYTPQAVAWAAEARVALFGFDLQGEPKAVNEIAVRIVEG